MSCVVFITRRPKVCQDLIAADSRVARARDEREQRQSAPLRCRIEAWLAIRLEPEAAKSKKPKRMLIQQIAN